MKIRWRIVTKGEKYKVQIKGWFLWYDLGEGWQPSRLAWVAPPPGVKHWTPTLHNAKAAAIEAAEDYIKQKQEDASPWWVVHQ